MSPKMPADSYGKIDPRDMNRLRNIIRMVDRQSQTFAEEIAEAISEQPARDIALYLVGKKPDFAGDWKQFAENLATTTRKASEDLVAIG